MSFNVAKTVRNFSLPVFLALAPAFAKADCADDPLGYADTLQNIDIDESTLTQEQIQGLRGMNAYAAIVELIGPAAQAAGNNIVDQVLQNREDIIEALGNGQRPEDFGMPAYQNYDAAVNAFICVMAELMGGIPMQQDRNVQTELERAFIRLLFETAITEDDIRARLETIEMAGAQGAMGSNNHSHGYAGQFLDAVKNNLDMIIADPDRASAYISFALSELQNDETEYNEGTLARILAPLVAHHGEHIPEYLDIIEADDGLFNATFTRFFNDLETRDFDERIFDILVEKTASDYLVVPRFAAGKLMELAALNPDLQDDVFDFFSEVLSDAQEYDERRPIQIFGSLKSRTSSVLNGDNEADKQFFMDFWHDVLESEGAEFIPVSAINNLLSILDAKYTEQSATIQSEIEILSEILYAHGATFETRYIPQPQDRPAIPAPDQ